ncbi:hypothetical protein NO2_1636 [Candidatus Termititenax persephonae]|uniref:Uncharacterized protein n=1 Tax=Candidatus Termititenax persephonae TaxID=2218525 RepID=A0A388TL84_9BACT|nr:hypothetical protein NO2_1636 [Candidatus Termititenax persephonae]
MLIEETEYMGKPMLSIKNDENDRFPFSFGIAKAKKVLGALEDIKQFVAKHDAPPASAKPDAGQE